MRKQTLYKDEEPVKRYYKAAPFVVFVVVVGILQIGLTAAEVPRYIFPTPLAILTALVNGIGDLLPDIGITLTEILAGYLIAVPVGIVLALLMTQFRIVNNALTPYTIFLATMPMIALVPLLMIWMGFGINVKIITVALQSFPVVMMNSATGFNNVTPVQLELMKSLGAGRLQTIIHVVLPASLHYIFTGMKLGSIFATTAAISCEFTGGSEGLGYRIFSATSFLKTETAFAGILCIAVIGIGLYNIVGLVEKKMLRWAR